MDYTVSEAQRAITELYVGIFNRAPDPEGLAFWTDKLVIDGADIDVVRAAFVSSIEWQDGVGQSTNAQVVFHLYESLFEREPDPEGLQFWVTALDEGRVTVDEIVKNLLDAASAYDQLTVDNKVDAALYYTLQSGGEDMVNNAGFNGAAATQAVDNVDYTSASVEASYAATDRSLQDEGSVISLTAADDEIIEGTQYDDIVRGALNDTLNGFDTIDGGDGNDTLEVVVRAGDGNTLGIPGFVDVQNVETLTLDIVNGGIDIELVGGDNFDDALNTVNVFSTGGTAESVRVEADVDEINIGMVRNDDGSFNERGVIESDVVVDVVDTNSDDTDTSVAVSTDRGAYITSTGDLSAVDVVADGQNIEGDSLNNDVEITVQGDIASVNSVAGDDTIITSLEGNIGAVNAMGSFEHDGSSITVIAQPQDDSSEAGNISSVTATAPTGSVSINALNNIGGVVARGDDGVTVDTTLGDIGSVSAPGWNDLAGDPQVSAFVDIDAADGAIGAVDAVASGNITVDASDDIGTVTATADGNVGVGSGFGAIGTVDAVAGGKVDVDASGDIGTVTATADGYVYVESGFGAIGTVDAVAGENVDVYASDDIGTVTATASDGYVNVDSGFGAIGTVDAVAGGGDIYVGAGDDIGTVTADGRFVRVDSEFGAIGVVDATGEIGVVVEASDNIGEVTASGYGVDVDSYFGDIGTVTANTLGYGTDGATVTVDAHMGGITSVDATAGDYIQVTARDDIGSVTATSSDGYVDVIAVDGSVGSVTATAEDGYVEVVAGEDVTSVTATAQVVEVIADDGSVGSVTATAEDGCVEVVAGEDVTSVTATARGDSPGDGFGAGDIYVQAISGSVGSVVGNASDDFIVQASSDIGSVAGVGDSLFVSAGGSVQTVDVEIMAGDDIDTAEDLSYFFGFSDAAGLPSGEDSLDAVIIGAASVGDVSISTNSSDESLDLFVASLGSVDSVSVDLGDTGGGFLAPREPLDATIDIHAQNDDAVTVSLSANSDAAVELFVGSVTSDTDTAPTELNLTVNNANEDAFIDVYAQVSSNYGIGSDEVSVLETVTVDGAGNGYFMLDQLNETLTTFDGSEGSGDQDVSMTINAGSDQEINITTGSGDDELYLSFSDGADHGTVNITTGDGDDVFDMNDSLDYVAGNFTVDMGAGDDDVRFFAASDATVSITAGGGSDNVEVWAASATSDAYVPVSMTVNAGSDDDVVEIHANRDSIEAASFDMGDGMNTLRYDYEPGGTTEWSDSDIERFDLDNVEGSVHTLGLDVELLISDDVTLDLTGVGGVSVLEIEGATLNTNGSVLTIDGAAADFTIEAGNNDFGNSNTSSHDADNSALLLSVGGVESLTINSGEEVGVVLDAALNGSLGSVNITTQEDDGEVSLVGFSDGFDATVTTGDDDAEIMIFSGDYGAITVSASDNADVTINGVDGQVTDSWGPNLDAVNVSIDAISVSSTYIDASDIDDADVEIRGDVWNGASIVNGVATIDIGTVDISGAFDSDLDIQGMSDGSTVTIDTVSFTLTQSDSDFTDGELGVDDVRGANISVGLEGGIDIDATAGSDTANKSFDIEVFNVDDSTIALGTIDIDMGRMSDDTDGLFNNTFGVTVTDADNSVVTVGEINANLDGAGFALDVLANDNTNVTFSDVTVTGEDASVSVVNNLATTDGTDVLIEFGDVTLTGTSTDGDGVSVQIINNDDEFSAGLMEVHVGDITMDSSDSALLLIEGNDGETDRFDTPIVPVVGVQIDIGDVNIDLSSGSITDSFTASLVTIENDGAHIVMGDVNVSMGNSDGSSYGYFTDSIVDNVESVIVRGDTTVTIGSSDESAGYSTSYIQGNAYSEITLGDYSVTVGANATDGDVGFGGLYVGVSANAASEITMGAVTLDSFGGDAAGGDSAYLTILDNIVSTVTISDVEVSSGVSVVDLVSNDDSEFSIGNVDLIGEVEIDVRVRDNDFVTVTVGDITMASTATDGDSTSMMDVHVIDNAVSMITIGDITATALNADIDFAVTDNDASSVYIGAVTLSDAETAVVAISGNEGTFLGRASVAISDVSVDASERVTADISYNIDSSIDVGNVSLTSMSSDVNLSIGYNSDSSIDVGNLSLTSMSSDVNLDIGFNDGSDVTLGNVVLDAGSDTDMSVVDNHNATIVGQAITISAGGLVVLDIDDNDGSAVTFSDVSLQGDSVTVTLDADRDGPINGSVSVGDIGVTTSDDFDFDVRGDQSLEDVEVGNLTVNVDTPAGFTDADSARVDIYADGVTGLDEITVTADGGDVDVINIDLRDNDDNSTYTTTTTSLIDLSGASSTDAVINLNFAGTHSDAGTPSGDAANFSDDIVIKFGDFATASVETVINDGSDMYDVDDLDGVRQTYVFEGSDIGDITVQGFVAGSGGYRDVSIQGPSAGSEDGRGPAESDGDTDGRDWWEYRTDNVDNLAALRTDRIDLSHFEGLTLDDLVFQYDDEEDSVTITAADGQFDGSIVVTGQGVDADTTGEDEQTIIDRVADSIIFG